MNFSEYRSKSIKLLWISVQEKYLCDERPIVNHPDFSTWQIDDICAINWKNKNPIKVCAGVLLDYIGDILN